MSDRPLSVFGLAGTGGFGREVMPVVMGSFQGGYDGVRNTNVMFVETEPSAGTVNGVPCVSEADFLELSGSPKFFNVAISDSHVRHAVASRFVDAGLQPRSIHERTAAISSTSKLGAGSILCRNSIITENVVIGDFFHANLNSYVAHDCQIGDFVTFAPGVMCNGNVHIGDHAYIGAGAMIRQGTERRPLLIGERAIVGMGAVVTKDVPPGQIVAGNPARPIRSK